jgi:preprotein translocase subunit YajC
MTLFPSFLLDAAPQSSALMNIAPLILVVGIFYVLLFLPMQKQKKAQAKMLSELKSGDAVVTTGGIVGTITVVEADTLILRVKPDNLKLQFARSAVSALVPADGAKETTRAGSK